MLIMKKKKIISDGEYVDLLSFGARHRRIEKTTLGLDLSHLLLMLFYSYWRVKVRDPHDCMPKHVSLTDPTVEISSNGKISKNRLK